MRKTFIYRDMVKDAHIVVVVHLALFAVRSMMQNLMTANYGETCSVFVAGIFGQNYIDCSTLIQRGG